MPYDSTRKAINSLTTEPDIIVVDFSNTINRWKLDYHHDEPIHSKHNVVCRFLSYFSAKDIIAVALASHPDNNAHDYVVWDAISNRYEDIYGMLFDSASMPDMEIWSNLDFVISLIVSDADEELDQNLYNNGITSEAPYLFEHWVSPTAALMESARRYREDV